MLTSFDCIVILDVISIKYKKFYFAFGSFYIQLGIFFNYIIIYSFMIYCNCKLEVIYI